MCQKVAYLVLRLFLRLRPLPWLPATVASDSWIAAPGRRRAAAQRVDQGHGLGSSILNGYEAKARVSMAANILDRVTRNPAQCGGAPCIRGLRMQVTDILSLLGNGASHQEILADYSFLEAEDIYSALLYSAENLNGNFHLTA
jgi:uncharacterized protein (DUF433 family)